VPGGGGRTTSVVAGSKHGWFTQACGNCLFLLEEMLASLRSRWRRAQVRKAVPQRSKEEGNSGPYPAMNEKGRLGAARWGGMDLLLDVAE